ncbi:MAG: (Na+)-NQR maturation NqrM [Gammaproteobacteria bacterium]|nr:(Na+)-NQR maturation NqrM [Gammaproteobacteria bacterium]MCP5425255.1 (Na+)-NQR maturation NqrM [Gammaproteobacteria bacterium]
MTTWLLTLFLFLTAFIGMAIGVLFKRAPIQGSCGGLNKIKGIECVCSEPCEDRKRAMRLASGQPFEG